VTNANRRIVSRVETGPGAVMAPPEGPIVLAGAPIVVAAAELCAMNAAAIPETITAAIPGACENARYGRAWR